MSEKEYPPCPICGEDMIPIVPNQGPIEEGAEKLVKQILKDSEC